MEIGGVRLPLIDYTLEGKVNKVDIAIQRIRHFDPIATGIFDTPYYVAYSGGKDSDVIRILCALAGVKHDLVHNHTTVDAPETVKYVRSIVKPENISYPKESMWKIIENHRTPPTRLIRYCCEELKERGGRDRFVMTGVRWAESASRKTRGQLEVQHKDKNKRIMLNADNEDSRRIFENCQTKGRRVLNPIIDWTDSDVWDFLEHYCCESNPLYKKGFMRIGCIGCPMANKTRIFEFEMYPKFKQNYIRAFERMLKSRISKGKTTMSSWNTAQDVFDWWIQDKNLDRHIDGQEFIDGWED
jgi:phosphoadenosine phosphosulfate reductase